MTDAITLFSKTTECVGNNLHQHDTEWLAAINAGQCDKAKLNYYDPPMLASQEAFEFSSYKKHQGWIDILKSDKKVVQIVVNLRYPRKRWFCKRKQDLNNILTVAENRFGQRNQVNIVNKSACLFIQKPLNVLVTSYEEGKHSFIEIKIAKGGFRS